MYDYTLFHAVPGAWRSVQQMRAALSNLEWLEHAAYLRYKHDLEQAAMKRAQRGGGGRGRGRF